MDISASTKMRCCELQRRRTQLNMVLAQILDVIFRMSDLNYLWEFFNKAARDEKIAVLWTEDFENVARKSLGYNFLLNK